MILNRDEYYGKDQVIWSAPIEDLTDWTYHGVCYVVTVGFNLYAPDVVHKGDTFYLYAAKQNGAAVYVATSKNPIGSFTDPRVLVNEDGCIYVLLLFHSSILC
jgi:beta-xylosidase